MQMGRLLEEVSKIVRARVAIYGEDDDTPGPVRCGDSAVASRECAG